MTDTKIDYEILDLKATLLKNKIQFQIIFLENKACLNPIGLIACSLFFLAEKVTSLGKDWHRPCLRCAKCNKTLSAGSHAEVSANTNDKKITHCLK